MSIFSELKRRNVFRVGIAYAVSAWVLLQVADLVLENIGAPPMVMRIFMLALAVGFPIALIFAWAFELTPEGLKLEKDVDRSQSITHITAQRMNRNIIIALAIAVVLLLVDKFTPDVEVRPGSPSPEVVQKEPGSPDEKLNLDPVSEKSIAVLPFVNMSSDPEQDYFADGISEEILNTLAQVSELKVAGRTSSFAFKGKNEDLLEIGKLLRVNHILEGSVRKSGNRVRITAQLIKVDDGFHMWSETWDRDLTDIFVIQDEISAAILAQLKTRLLGDQKITAAETNPQVYERYLLAKQRIYERNQASLEMAVKLLNEGLEIDNEYAPAYAQLGIANLLSSDRNYGTLSHMEAGELAKKNLEKALQLDPDNAEALAGMGLYISNYELDHEKAIAFYRKALAINPNLNNASTWLATELDQIGELQESIKIRQQTFERDPLHPPTYTNLQQSYMVMGQNERARQLIENLRAYLPSDAQIYSDLGQIGFMSGQLAEAEVYLRKSYENEPLNTVNRFWYSIVLMQARQYESMAQIAPDRPKPLALSRLGRLEEATILGNRSIGEGINPDFYFRVLVENGRYEELIKVLESRWGNLDEFSKDWPGRGGYGYWVMGCIAKAYHEVGDEAMFEQAMQSLKKSLDAQLAEGASNWVLSQSIAQYAVLAGDYDKAINFMEKSFQQGGYVDTENQTAWSFFKPLDGDPRYEAAKAAMNARLQEELKKMEQEKGSGSITQSTTQPIDTEGVSK
jgi:TolB-like protein/Tfp pilus assembly protein PilF